MRNGRELKMDKAMAAEEAALAARGEARKSKPEGGASRHGEHYVDEDYYDALDYAEGRCMREDD
jgi:hypothetical protein